MDKKVLVLLFLFVISGLFYYHLTLPRVVLREAVVVRVIDGDTVVLGDGVRVRLLGINTPERGQPFSVDASLFLSSLVLNRSVMVEMRGFDKYNRSLGYLFVHDELVNRLMLLNGFATLFVYDHDEYFGVLSSAEEYARLNGFGLWRLSSDASCLELVRLQYVEPGTRCSNGEVLELKNNCGRSLSFSFKDDATHLFNASLGPYGSFTKRFSCVFNDAGDSLLVYDSEGLLLFYRYP